MKYLKITACLFLMSFGGFAQDDNEEQKQWNHYLGVNVRSFPHIGFSGATPSFSAYSPKGYFHRVDLFRFRFNLATYSQGLDFWGQYIFGKRLYERNWFSFDLGLTTGLNTYLFENNSYPNWDNAVGLSLGLSPQFNFQLNQRLCLTTRYNFSQAFSKYAVKTTDDEGSVSTQWKSSMNKYSDFQIGLRVKLFK